MQSKPSSTLVKSMYTMYLKLSKQFLKFSSIFYLQKLKMINIEIKIKVAAAGGDYGKLQLQTWHQSTPITY